MPVFTVTNTSNTFWFVLSTFAVVYKNIQQPFLLSQDHRLYRTYTKTNLSQTFLSCPHRSVNDFQEKLSRARIEDKDCSIDWFRGQVTLKRL